MKNSLRNVRKNGRVPIERTAIVISSLQTTLLSYICHHTMLPSNNLITRLFFVLLLFLLPFSSCKKDDFLTDGDTALEFSQDEILFDTVFVSVGSVTKNLKVYNPYDQPIKTNIRLAGSGINFRMNVNGVPGRTFNNVEIRAKDSLWIFVEVTVDPGSGVLPFVLEDSIIFETNGNVQDVDLTAWGQNAHFIVADHFPSGLPSYALMDTALHANITWDSILPYVIYGFAVVDSTQTLTIEPGTQIHFYNNSGLWIYKGGTLRVQGNKEHPVVFQGTRRENTFAEEPGQWDRIWLNNGSFSEINYAVIKNGFIGLQCDVFPKPAAPDQLYISNTQIRNMSGAGIYSSNYTIKGWNNVISACGSYALFLSGGGDYDFTHCTVGNYWNYAQRSSPSVYISNYVVEGNTAVIDDLRKASFRNCIIDGNQDDELAFDFLPSSTTTNNYSFTYCLIKAKETDVSDSHFSNICKNCNAGFDPSNGNYTPGSGSQADIGEPSVAAIDTFKFDITGFDRQSQPPPTAGAYEIH